MESVIRPRNRRDRTTTRHQVATAIRKIQQENTKHAYLIHLTGISAGQSIPVDLGLTVLGRDRACDATLPGEGISRRHLAVRRSGPSELWVRDLQSTNGTFYDGRRISERVLREGDRILLGRDTVLRVAFHDELEQQYQQQIYASSVRDPLTGLYNRRHFDEQLSTNISFAARYGMPLTVILLDIDEFKRVNDSYGHRAGDAVLRELSKAMSGRTRAEDLVFRYGGEEFAIISLGIDEWGAAKLAEALRSRAEGLVVHHEDAPLGGIRFTISAGSVTARFSRKRDPGPLISAADRNLYRAKTEGRNRVITSSFG